MKRLILFVAIFGTLLLFCSSDQISALNCSEVGGNQVSALTKLQSENLDMYVRANLDDQVGGASLYFQSETNLNNCTKLTSFDITRDWQKVGSFPTSLAGSSGVLIMTLNENATASGASTPQLIFASTTPPCDILNGCEYSYFGQKLTLAPRKVSTSADSLRIGLLSDPSKNRVEEVIYSVDGVQVYTKKKLETFNYNYVPGGDHSIERTLLLSSGQSLSDKQLLKRGSVADVRFWFISLYSHYSKFIIFFGSIVGILLVWYISYTVSRLLYMRHLWRKTHIASQGFRIDASDVGAQPESKFKESPLTIITQHKKVISIPLLVVTAAFMTYSFVLSTFTVDGVSMFPTLQDKSVHPLYILPSVVGKITGSGYTPSRGTIVVIQKDESTLFDTGVQPKSYVVKRVVGLPTERVVITSDKITIYNKEHPSGFVPDDQNNWLKKKPEIQYSKIDITMKQGELFVVGYNRDESIDSRF